MVAYEMHVLINTSAARKPGRAHADVEEILRNTRCRDAAVVCAYVAVLSAWRESAHRPSACPALARHQRNNVILQRKVWRKS